MIVQRMKHNEKKLMNFLMSEAADLGNMKAVWENEVEYSD
jgi:hypothetical protein